MKKLLSLLITVALILGLSIFCIVEFSSLKKLFKNENENTENISTDLSSLENRIKELEDEISKNNLSIEELDHKIESVSDSISTIENTLDELTTSTSNNAKAIEDAKALIGKNADDVESLEELIEALELKLDGLKEELKVLEITWNGEDKDITWFDGDKEVYELSSAKELAGIAKLVDAGQDFEGVTVKLTDDIYLNGCQWDPIENFKGTFDGNGNTINDLTIYSTSLYGADDFSYNGLFRSTTNATIKNINIDGATLLPYLNYEEVQDSNGYWNYEGEKGILIGKSYGDIEIENVTISNCNSATYNNNVAGLIGEVEDGTVTIKDVTVDNTNTFQTFWGTYDSSVAGLVGCIKSGAKVKMINCYSACRIDAINDACANYQYYVYRYSGMLCGFIQGKNSTNYQEAVEVENCTVVFDAWNQYRYCKNENNDKFTRINNVDGEWGSMGAPESHEHSYEVNSENHNRLMTFANIFGFSTGNGRVQSVSENIVQVGDHFEDTTTIPGLTIIYLNGSQEGI